MRAVIQRVSEARVKIENAVAGEIGPGLLVLLGVASGDTDADALWLAGKICALRIFADADGKMNRSVADLASGAADPGRSVLLVVSQFTLLAGIRKGTRPSFHDAARPEVAIPLYELFVRHARSALPAAANGVDRVATGRFGAMMSVSLVNDGPVTLILDSHVRE